LDSLSRIWTNHFCYQRLYKRRPGECEEIHGKNTLLGDLDDTGSYVDHELSIDDTDLVKATAVGTDVVESCEKRLYAKLLGRLPSLANITQASIDEYSAKRC
jgi:hypothetical protein